MDNSPLALDGWIEYNCRKWKLKPLKLLLYPNEAKSSSIEGVFYLNSKGRITKPDLNPYSPISCNYSSTENPSRVYRQWLELAELLVLEIKKHKLNNYLFLPPEIIDVRPWQWKGFRTNVRYSLLLDLPLKKDCLHSSVSKNINKAFNRGFKYEKGVKSLNDIYNCIVDTEQRQNFTYNVSKADLQLLNDLLSEDNFRAYSAYDTNGKIAATRIILSRNGGTAIDWIAATQQEYLSSGVTQGLINFILDDLSKDKISSFDFVGAGLPNVALAKIDWGAKIIPYYMISEFDLKWLWYVFRSKVKSNKQVPVYC